MISAFVVPFGLRSRMGPTRIPCGVWKQVQRASSTKSVGEQATRCSKLISSIELTVKKSIFKSQLEGKDLLLCVSGGSDSVAMMQVMASLHQQKVLTGKLAIVNFNHKLRTESDEEVCTH